MKIGCYQIKCKKTGKFYIGSSANMPNRKAQHVWTLKKGVNNTPSLQTLFNEDKNFDRFEWSFIITQTRDQAYDVEQSLIDKHWGDPLLLNVSKDARSPFSGFTLSEESREKGRLKRLEALKDPEHVERHRQAVLKMWQDPDRRKDRMGAGNPGAKRISIDGNIYGSVNEAGRILKIDIKKLRFRALSDDPQWKRYFFPDQK